MSQGTRFYDLLKEEIKLEINTVLPAKVVRYYSGTAPKTADVQILFKMKSKGGQTTNYPMLPAVPVLRHVGPLIPGDVVLLTIAQRCLDNLQAEPFDPDSVRKFDIRDAVIVGVFDM